MAGDDKPVLWCVHVLGPDDVYAFPDREKAAKWAMKGNGHFWFRPFHPYDPIMNFIVTEWPHSAEAHAADMARGDERFR